MEDSLIDVIECAATPLMSPICIVKMSGDSNGLFNEDPNVVVFIMNLHKK